MLEKVKQMLGALLAAVGDGENVSEVTLTTAYTKMNDDTVTLSSGVQVVFDSDEQVKGDESYDLKDGEVH